MAPDIGNYCIVCLSFLLTASEHYIASATLCLAADPTKPFPDASQTHPDARKIESEKESKKETKKSAKQHFDKKSGKRHGHKNNDDSQCSNNNFKSFEEMKSEPYRWNLQGLTLVGKMAVIKVLTFFCSTFCHFFQIFNLFLICRFACELPEKKLLSRSRSFWVPTSNKETLRWISARYANYTLLTLLTNLGML
jgi:hypothetical protein